MNEIDQYIPPFPRPVQDILQQIRLIINKQAPDAEEGIAYGMPGL